jgi:hypothetical protein
MRRRTAGVVAIAAACTPFGSSGVDGSSSGPSNDAGTAADASRARGFCGSRDATFCDDFDGLPFKDKWRIDDQSATGGGVLDISHTFVSAPNSFEAFLPEEAGTERRARLCQTFPAASALRLTYDQRIAVMDGSTVFDLASLRFNPAGGQTLYINVNALTGVWRLVQEDLTAGPAVPTTFRTPFVLDTWQHVELRAALTPTDGGSTVIASIVADGSVVATSEQPWPRSSALDSEVCVGITYVPNSTMPLQVLTDNVTIDVTPL